MGNTVKFPSMPSRGTQTTLLTGVAAVVIGAWATHFLGPRSQPDPPPNPSPLPHPSPIVVDPAVDEIERQLASSRISFADWQALVKEGLDREQRKRVFERYRGERVTWQGYVGSVNHIKPEYGASTSAQFLVAIYENKPTLNSKMLGRAPALCIFPMEADEQLDELQQGQRVVIQGTFADPTLHGELLGTRLYNCKILR